MIIVKIIAKERNSHNLQNPTSKIVQYAIKGPILTKLMEE